MDWFPRSHTWWGLWTPGPSPHPGTASWEACGLLSVLTLPPSTITPFTAAHGQMCQSFPRPMDSSHPSPYSLWNRTKGLKAHHPLNLHDHLCACEPLTVNPAGSSYRHTLAQSEVSPGMVFPSQWSGWGLSPRLREAPQQLMQVPSDKMGFMPSGIKWLYDFQRFLMRVAGVVHPPWHRGSHHHGGSKWPPYSPPTSGALGVVGCQRPGPGKQCWEERAFIAPVHSSSTNSTRVLGEHFRFLVQRTWWAWMSEEMNEWMNDSSLLFYFQS